MVLLAAATANLLLVAFTMKSDIRGNWTGQPYFAVFYVPIVFAEKRNSVGNRSIISSRLAEMVLRK